MEKHSEERFKKLVESLELVTARMLEMTTATNQLASSTTPELRQLFDKWITSISEEICRVACADTTLDIGTLATQLGLSRASALSLLLTLDRRGMLAIRTVTVEKGSGKNTDICDCMTE